MRLTPRASRDAVEGIEAASDGSVHLKARVRAVPEKGKANAALEALLASALGVPASAIAVTGGATARLKTVHISAAPDMLAGRLEALARPD